MPKSFVNFCYNIAGKRETKKQREDGQYVLLSGQSQGNAEPVAPAVRDEDSDSSQKSPGRKLDFINKLFKTKAKNSDDEATISSVYDRCDEKENDLSPQSANACQSEAVGVINRKKKRSLAFYDSKSRQQKKHPGMAKIRPATPWIRKNKELVGQEIGDKDEASAKIASSEQDLKPVVTLIEDRARILEQFDPLWVDKKSTKIEEQLDSVLVVNDKVKPVKPPRNKVTNDKVMPLETLAEAKMPDLKVATMEIIPEQELALEDEMIQDGPKEIKIEKAVKAKVSYEGLEGVFVTPVVHDPSDAVKEGVFPTAASKNATNLDLLKDIEISSPEPLPVFAQPRKNPWNVWSGLFEDSLGEPTKDKKESDDSKMLSEWLEGSNPVSELGMLLYQSNGKTEEETDQMIAQFFAEEQKVLNERDIAKYTKNIEISKIEIYEEDIKRYHKSLKYHRGPVDHDIIFTTVETALNFVEKLTKEREQKKRFGFLPEFLDKCLKSKARREKEKEEEERKKREKEEKKKQGPLKPKMWLVFNRFSKEKVIICTPGEFYDSD